MIRNTLILSHKTKESNHPAQPPAERSQPTRKALNAPAHTKVPTVGLQHPAGRLLRLLAHWQCRVGQACLLPKSRGEKHATADKAGSCLCGAVAFEITGPLRPVIACHCHRCCKQTGTYMSSTAVKNEQFRLSETRGLRWYRSSDTGRSEDSASNAVRCCSGRVTGTSRLQLLPAREAASGRLARHQIIRRELRHP